MNFKYFDNYQKLAFLTKGEVECEICKQTKISFETMSNAFICLQCLFDKRLYDRHIFINKGNPQLILSQLKMINSNLSEEQLIRLANDKTKEVEQATPPLVTWQDMRWLCLDGDYGKFIGYASKPFLNSLAKDGDGQSLFKKSLHPELQEYYTETQWLEMVPNELIADYHESNEYRVLFYVFKSLTTDNIAIWWDSN